MDLTPNSKEIARFLKILGYESGEKASLRFFYPSSDERSKTDHGKKADVVLSNGWMKPIIQNQRQGRGAYFVVNKGGAKDADIKECVSIFCEWDNIDKSVQVDLWKNIGLPEPTIQVDTGGKSIHCYWVLDSPISTEDWRSLQIDLLNFADADRSLKNPSRVMRLPGAYHMGPNGPCLSSIINASEIKYSFDTLRSAIPSSEKKQQPIWADFDRSFTLPISDDVPLLTACEKKTRERVQNGVQKGDKNTEGRNSYGAQVARDLIGTEQYLRSIGQSIDGDAYTLFLQFCQRCDPTDWDENEWEQIYQSAKNDSPGPSLSPDKIENCIKGWAWQRRKKDPNDFPSRDFTPTLTTELTKVKDSFAAHEKRVAKLAADVDGLTEDIDELDDLIIQSQADSGLSVYEKSEKIEQLSLQKKVLEAKLRRAKERAKDARSDRNNERVKFNALRRDQAAQDKDEKPTAFESDSEVIQELGDRLSYNALTQQGELDGIPLELDHPRPELSSRTGFTAWQSSDNAVKSMVLFQAKLKTYCPIQQYIEQASGRYPDAEHTLLDNLALKIFGTDSEVQNAFLKCFLIGSVKRALDPGCTLPYMLVLYSGEQGTGKSSAIKALYGRDFTGEGQIDFGVDGLLAMNLSWAYEIPECDEVFGGSKASVSKIKNFITIEADTYRAPYAAAAKRHKRRTVLIGTTNQREVLHDETGERRFAIIEIKKHFRIDTAWIAANRDLIWSAAAHGVQSGVQPIIPERLFAAAAAEAESFKLEDPWLEDIDSWLGHRTEARINEIAKECLQIELSRKTLKESKRIGAILRRLGWEKKDVKRNGKTIKIWQKSGYYGEEF